MSSAGALQEEVIRHLQIRGADSELVRTIYVQELNRVKYMMRAYLRCRLLKIEKFVMHVLDNEEEQEKLSPQELHHAQVGHDMHLPSGRIPGIRKTEGEVLQRFILKLSGREDLRLAPGLFISRHRDV